MGEMGAVGEKSNTFSTSRSSHMKLFSVWSGWVGYPGAGRIPWYLTLSMSSVESASSGAYPQSSWRILAWRSSAKASARRSATASIMIPL